jgi:predicted small secreted protein
MCGKFSEPLSKGSIMKRKCVLLALMALALPALLSCNTARGIGKDIEDGGRAIQRATH